jgi:G3E family GTPase
VIASGPGHTSRIQQLSVVREAPWSWHTLELFLQALADNAGPRLLRVKGIVHVEDSPQRPAVLHGAQQLVHTLQWLEHWPGEDRRTRIQFITIDWPAAELQQLVDDVERFARRSRAVRPSALT